MNPISMADEPYIVCSPCLGASGEELGAEHDDKAEGKAGNKKKAAIIRKLSLPF